MENIKLSEKKVVMFVCVGVLGEFFFWEVKCVVCLGLWWGGVGVGWVLFGLGLGGYEYFWVFIVV